MLVLGSHCHQGEELEQAETFPVTELQSSPKIYFVSRRLSLFFQSVLYHLKQQIRKIKKTSNKLTFPKAVQESLLNAEGVVAKALEPPEANPEELNVLKA